MSRLDDIAQPGLARVEQSARVDDANQVRRELEEILPERHRVRYSHRRIYRRRVSGPHLADRLDELAATEMRIETEPRGGKTYCMIYNGDGRVVSAGEAVCRPTENYVKAAGRTIALYRALKQLERFQAEDAAMQGVH